MTKKSGPEGGFGSFAFCLFAVSLLWRSLANSKPAGDTVVMAKSASKTNFSHQDKVKLLNRNKLIRTLRPPTQMPLNHNKLPRLRQRFRSEI